MFWKKRKKERRLPENAEKRQLHDQLSYQAEAGEKLVIDNGLEETKRQVRALDHRVRRVERIADILYRRHVEPN